jgi:hypothetical protein
MNQNVQKLLTALPLSLKRFPFAWIALLLFTIWYPLGKQTFGYNKVFMGEIFAFLLGFLTLYPIYFLNIAFRLRSEMGRPISPWIQAFVYGFYAAWPTTMAIILDHFDLDIPLVIPAVDLIPVALLFILPFWNNPHLLNPWPFAKRMICRFLIACLIAVLAFFLLNIIWNDLDHALKLIKDWKFPDPTSSISLMLLLPGLFLMMMPVPEKPGQWTENGDPVTEPLSEDPSGKNPN